MTKKLTTAAGCPVVDNQNTMTAGPRGPVLLQDVWYLEKLAHFDREVIPERRMHAKGSAAYGTFTVTQAAIAHLKQSAAGSIIVMSSLAGRFGYPNRSPYATTKWGLIGFTKTLSRELGEFGIRVNAILPGAVAGPRLQQVFEARAAVSGRSVAQEEAAALANQSIKRFVDPADIAALAVFLASEAGRSISGQMLPIDGDSQSAS